MIYFTKTKIKKKHPETTWNQHLRFLKVVKKEQNMLLICSGCISRLFTSSLSRRLCQRCRMRAEPHCQKCRAQRAVWCERTPPWDGEVEEHRWKQARLFGNTDRQQSRYSNSESCSKEKIFWIYILNSSVGGHTKAFKRSCKILLKPPGMRISLCWTSAENKWFDWRQGEHRSLYNWILKSYANGSIHQTGFTHPHQTPQGRRATGQDGLARLGCTSTVQRKAAKPSVSFQLQQRILFLCAVKK